MLQFLSVCISSDGVYVRLLAHTFRLSHSKQFLFEIYLIQLSVLKATTSLNVLRTVYAAPLK